MARLHTVPSRLASAPSRLTRAAPAPEGSSRFRKLYRTARWLEIRRRVLVEHMYTCAMCGLVSDRGMVCDHVDPHTADETEEKFWAGPFQALCSPCHSSKKQAQDAQRKASSR